MKRKDVQQRPDHGDRTSLTSVQSAVHSYLDSMVTPVDAEIETGLEPSENGKSKSAFECEYGVSHTKASKNLLDACMATVHHDIARLLKRASQSNNTHKRQNESKPEYDLTRMKAEQKLVDSYIKGKVTTEFCLKWGLRLCDLPEKRTGASTDIHGNTGRHLPEKACAVKQHLDGQKLLHEVTAPDVADGPSKATEDVKPPPKRRKTTHTRA